MSKLIGFFTGSFTDQKTGQIIDYAKVYVSDPIEKGGFGEQTVAYKARPAALAGLTQASIGKSVNVLFDQYQKVCMVQIADSKKF